ncbi:MAG: M12 family metallo-peptidase [Steroidobacteraceae bacterium]
MQLRLAAALTGLLLTILAPFAGAAEFRILRYEPITLSEAVHPQATSDRRTASPGIALRFRAYDTDFALDMERNDRVNEGMPLARRGTAVAWRGSVVGRPGSWVRLTRSGARTVGMLFDGRELYTIESGADARPHIRNPVARLAEDALVIYRLSDTLTDLEGEFCGVELVPGVSTQADVYRALAAQLQMDATASLTATKQLEVAAIADFELTQAHANDTEAVVLARLNIVDGIFSNQVGVHLAVQSVTSFPTDTDPFTTTVPSDLLAQVATYRFDTPAQQAAGLTHLMTGRNLDGNTVGIAFFGSLCTRRNSASLSEATGSLTTAALIAAHEIGHVFGAPHDGEAGGACAGQTGPFIMASQLNGSQEFSPCSLQQMQTIVDGGSCLAPVLQADAALVVPASAPLALNQTTVVTFAVRSDGPGAISNVQVTVAVPAGILAVGAGATGGTCQVKAAMSQIVCALSTIPAGESREVQMSLRGLSPGTTNANITLTASNDGIGTNNTAQLTLVTAPGADVSVGVTASSATLETGTTGVATITVTNRSSVTATGTRLSATLPTGLAAVSVATNALGCTVDAAASFACSPTSLAANSSLAVALTVRATSAGSRRLGVSAVSELGDPDAANNNSGVTLTITDPAVVVVTPPPSGSSGGGGQLGGELLVLALALELGRRRRADRPFCR